MHVNRVLVDMLSRLAHGHNAGGQNSTCIDCNEVRGPYLNECAELSGWLRLGCESTRPWRPGRHGCRDLARADGAPEMEMFQGRQRRGCRSISYRRISRGRRARVHSSFLLQRGLAH